PSPPPGETRNPHALPTSYCPRPAMASRLTISRTTRGFVLYCLIESGLRIAYTTEGVGAGSWPCASPDEMAQNKARATFRTSMTASTADDCMSNGKNHNCRTVEAVTSAAEARRCAEARHIYVHIPFCARICPYCAFYKDLLDRSQTSRFCEALLRELASHDCRGSRLLPSTIYFGGGTPTAINIAQLE